MEKRRRSEPTIITARGGAAGDEHHNISTSTNCVDDFDEDIRRFGIDRKVPEALSLYVSLSEETQVLWYKKLLEAWTTSDSPPDTPEEATKLVFETLKRVHPHGLDVADLEGFLFYHGLPGYFSKSKPAPLGEALSVAEDAREFSLNTSELTQLGKGLVNLEDGPAFLLKTLPVFEASVTNGCCFTVFVEVNEFYLLPSKMLFVISERCRALAAGDNHLADALLDELNTEDYEVLDINLVKVLTKKYQIKLRGVAAVEIGTEARAKLVKMIDNKCLTIAVYYLDDDKHWVGDVYCNGIYLNEKLLTGGCATFYD